MTDFSILLAFSQLVLNKTDEEKKLLADQIGIDLEEYNSRIKGKEKEAELIIILKSMGCLKHFEAYDEGLSYVTDENTPDFVVELLDGYKMMIEVKHTNKDVYKISLGNLSRRIEFAKRHEMPLRFAVSIKGCWGLFTAEEMQEKGGKLSIKNFYGKESVSWWDKELETCSYMFQGRLRIRSVYSKDFEKNLSIYFNPYGQLVSYELYSDDRKVFRIKGKNSKYLPYTFYLEALQNRLANNKQIIEEYGDVTIVTDIYEDKSFCLIPEYEFLIAPISHTVKYIDGNFVRFDALKMLASKHSIFLDKNMLRFIISDLVEKGVDVMVFKDSMGYSFEDYRRIYWTK